MLFGPRPNQILASDDATVDIPCADATTVWSRSFSLQNGLQFSIWLKAAGTTPRLDVFLEQSYKLPTTEGATDADWVVPEGNSPILNDLADANAHIVANIAPAVLPYGRLKIVPNVSNGNNTTLQAVLGVQSER